MSVEYGKGNVKTTSSESHSNESTSSGGEEIIQNGSVNYTVAVGMNSTKATYQDASGAPVETDSPLGYSVNFWTSLCLNINQMVGTGIFSTR